jgi:hypothetical protein
MSKQKLSVPNLRWTASSRKFTGVAAYFAATLAGSKGAFIIGAGTIAVNGTNGSSAWVF